jgi:hypothetical protein
MSDDGGIKICLQQQYWLGYPPATEGVDALIRVFVQSSLGGDIDFEGGKSSIWKFSQTSTNRHYGHQYISRYHERRNFSHPLFIGPVS